MGFGKQGRWRLIGSSHLHLSCRSVLVAEARAMIAETVKSSANRMDPWNWRAQKADGFRIISLASARQEGDLKAWVANDHRATPADHAAFLIDFEDWLGRLSERRRQSAELLAQGFGTLEVAQQVGLSPGAISQARTALERNWKAFQQDPPA